MQQTAQWVDGLAAADHRTAYQYFQLLLDESHRSAAVYHYFDRFAAMIDSSNTYLRTRGLLLLAANAPWDDQGKLAALLDRLLAHITDAKPTVARQLIQALPAVATARPELAERIRQALAAADTSGYADSMRPLVEGDIAAALEAIAS